VVNLRQLANRLGFEKIVLKNEKMIGYFVSNQDSPLYKSQVFTRILSFVQKQPRRFRMKEQNNKLTLACEPIHSVTAACELLKTLYTREG